LVALAAEKGVKLAVFKRRWDSDLKTVRQVFDGVLGEVEAEFHLIATIRF
jgi:predicted dehydrogenase